MAKIEGVLIQNYRALKSVCFGSLHNDRHPLTDFSAVIGKNGVGKSTLLDAFGFLGDCLKLGVATACDIRGRGGFHQLRTQGEGGPIAIMIDYNGDRGRNRIRYHVAINFDSNKGAIVEKETLTVGDRELLQLELKRGKGTVRIGTERQVDLDPGMLGIATLGALNEHPRISAVREFLEGWYLSYFSPHDVRNTLPLSGPQKRLNERGDNLGNVVQFMEREHPDKFQSILTSIATKIPGVETIGTEKTSDGRLLLKFNDRGFQDPFYASQMSDGTLKVFAYMLLMADPNPPPFICIEEPENGLYPKLLEALAKDFRAHADGSATGTQILLTTHQPYLLDGMTPEEVWIMEKGQDGFATIRRASDDPLVKNMAAEGLPLGGLWYSDYFDAR